MRLSFFLTLLEMIILLGYAILSLGLIWICRLMTNKSLAPLETLNNNWNSDFVSNIVPLQGSNMSCFDLDGGYQPYVQINDAKISSLCICKESIHNNVVSIMYEDCKNLDRKSKPELRGRML